MELEEKIENIILNVLKIQPEIIKELSPDETLNRIGVDSVNFIEIVISLEEEFNIAFEDDELLLQNLNTVNKLKSVISNKLN
ncbi:acyl carrier protein [Ruminiclostridium cellobioparum]|uniref:Phosphopantetheine attachment site n=1 Tax=Ruminiclostridium cellobioparum subsp. termitidis CT1112 TaxID=1195236 RepID=S0FH05_RUMCE|nr:acyl carrier protein [Ruminiclostridium cellobioparum]EMS70587.1 Phosphopantetheine attachment site [Ruminiclostridium cellobioparum subsp. termitidis CT1112]